MTKPTILQSLLGRPSQSYAFPHEQKEYFSTRRDMLRIAAERAGVDGDQQNERETSETPHSIASCELTSVPTTVSLDTLPLVIDHIDHIDDRIDHSCDDAEQPEQQPVDTSEDDSENDVYYTPNTSPRTSMVAATALSFPAPAPAAVQIPPSLTRNQSYRLLAVPSTRIPSKAPRPSSTTSLSSTIDTASLDGHSLFDFSSSSAPSTRMTTPINSDAGHEPKRPARVPKKSYAYTDEDWAKEVRWLVTPPAVKSTTTPMPNSKRRLQSSTPYAYGTLPQKSKPSISKSISKTTPSIMMNMTALLEEDEDREISVPSLGLPKNSVLISSPSRMRSTSSPGVKHPAITSSVSSSPPRNPAKTGQSVQHSLSTTSSHKPNLQRRRSRSLDPIPVSFTTPYIPPSNSLPSNGTPGFTSLVLPRAPLPLSSQPTHLPSLGLGLGTSEGKVDLTRDGVAQTTMASVEVVQGLGNGTRKGMLGGLFGGLGRSASSPSGSGGSSFVPGRKRRATSMAARKGKGIAERPLGFTSYRKPPDYVPGGSVLVQVWGVAVDGVDGRLVGLKYGGTRGVGAGAGSVAVRGRASTEDHHEVGPKAGLVRTFSLRSKIGRSGSGSWGSSGAVSTSAGEHQPHAAEVGFIPGRSFVGRVIECGWEVRDEVARKGEWVMGLLDVRKCGALAEFIVVDRHRLHRAPYPRMSPSSPILPPPPQLLVYEPLSQYTTDTGSIAFAPTPYALDAPVAGPSNLGRYPSASRPQHRYPNPYEQQYPNQALYANSPLSLSTSVVKAGTSSIPGRLPSLTLEELALLPLCGVPAYRAVRTFAYAFSSLREKGGDHLGTHRSTVGDAAAVIRNGEGMGDGYDSEGDGGGRRRRALVLRGHDGVGAMAVQMLVRRGWRVCVHAPCRFEVEAEARSLAPSSDGSGGEGNGDVKEAGGGRVEKGEGEKYMESVEARVRAWGGDEVVFDEGGGEEAAVRVIDGLCGEGDVFDAVLDTIGGKEVWEASERLLRCCGPLDGTTKKGKRGMGQFTTIVGDAPGRTIPSAGDHFRAGLRSLRFGGAGGSGGPGIVAGGERQGKGKVGYAWVSIAQDVDWEGEDIRDTVGAVLRMAVEDGVRPWVGEGYGVNAVDEEMSVQGDGGRVVPFERAPDVFVDGGPLGDGETVVVKIVG